MNKKELRKELELQLVKSIDAVLSKKNATVAKNIRKNTFGASKTLAKKFYKSLKTKTAVKSVHPTGGKATKSVVKKSTKTAVKKTVSAAKRSSSKAKNKK